MFIFSLYLLNQFGAQRKGPLYFYHIYKVESKEIGLFLSNSEIMNLQRTPTMKLRSRDIPEDETRGEPSNVAGEKTSFQNEKNTEISSLNIATTNVVYTSRTPRMTAEVTSTMANLVLPGSPRHCQVSNIPYEATCVNDRATTNQSNLIPHSDGRDIGHEVDQASMATGTTFFPNSEQSSTQHPLMYTRVNVIIRKNNGSLDISFQSTSERTTSVREVTCRCYRNYPETIFLSSEDYLLFKAFCKGNPQGLVTISFTLPKNFDTSDWHKLIENTGLDSDDFVHIIIDCLNKSSNIIDLRNFDCLLGEDESL